MAKQPKLTKLLEDIFQEQPQINKYEVIEGVRSFGIVGKALYNNGNIMEIAKQLSQIAENAHGHVLSETDDWFDKVSVNKNMQSLKKNVAEFKKAAMESHQLNQRLTGLYEDIGHVLNRYYDISEDSGDRDNDGINEPDDEEYLQNKRDAITKAVKSEAVGDADNLDMVDRPNAPAKDGRDNENEGLDHDKGPAKDGNNNLDNYASEDGESMNETSPGHRTGGENDPESEDGSGEELRELKRSLKDVGGVVGIPALGQIARKLTNK